ncbi:hypothetical protein CPB86DRAFT_706780 [Serendipita vermifera]|nr:hypothetical protein CPB86DRAFT_706780 [Serendipita vermifera]
MKELKDLKADTWEWLDAFIKRWNWWQSRLNVLCSTLVYLDLVILNPDEDKLSIRDNGLQRFEEIVVESPSIVERTQSVIRQWCLDEREARSSKSVLIALHRLVECMNTLGCYGDHIEEPYLRFLGDHYAEKAKHTSKLTALAYLQICVDDVVAEESRGKGILRDETRTAAGIKTLQQLILPHVEWLANDALDEIITKQDKISLKKLDEAFLRVTASSETWNVSPNDSLLEHYRNNIFRRVKEIVTDTAEDARMIERLLELKEFLDDCLSSSCLNDVELHDRKFTYATWEAFERGFMCRKIKPAELIAKHVDSLMRRGQKAASDAEFFAEMKRVLTLYRFSADKDVFRTFYNRALAKRLLLGRSASDDFEKEVIKVLSESYDAAFSDQAQMFSDLAISKDLVEEYRNVKRGQPPRPDIGLSVMVLQHSVWPVIRKVTRSETGVEVRLPSKMEEALVDFVSFYGEKHANRQLTWAHYLGTATLIARFPSGRKELSVSMYQAVVLLLFNERPTWTTQEIQDRISLNTQDLTLTLQSLALGRKLVLKRVSDRLSKGVRPDDQFTINEDFTDPRVKIHINTIQQSDTLEETQQAVKVIDQYRDASLDAAIVRIMKAKKTLKSQQLIAETIDAVNKHFKPEVKAIKLRIDSLMEREFIARKDGSSDTFVYLA